MAVKIRLARRGRKKAATYDIVVADARAPRDGRFIEKLGTYNPNTNPATINYDGDRAFYWVMNGAQPTETVRAMLAYRGVLLRRNQSKRGSLGCFGPEAGCCPGRRYARPGRCRRRSCRRLDGNCRNFGRSRRVTFLGQPAA
ncbi:MAG: 30S ribosomal protein S16 [Hymenobacter sp.]|nr:MAG: 30S ribosomal protein S16 [Hymenobacter sp.]